MPLLRAWRIPFRKIGREVAWRGIKDPEIIPLLQQLRRVTFFTQDAGFWQPVLGHSAYCLVWLNVPADDAALFVRRFLKHPRFNTQTSRMGMVVRAHHDGLQFWPRPGAALQRMAWSDRR